MFFKRGSCSAEAEDTTDYGQAWLELEQLHKRVAELESQLGIATMEGGKRIPHGLKFKVTERTRAAVLFKYNVFFLVRPSCKTLKSVILVDF